MVKKKIKKKSKPKFDKTIAIERIRLIREAYSQLRSGNHATVAGNIVSVVPVFALQTLYSLGWGNDIGLNSLKTHGSSKINMNTTTIMIKLKMCQTGKEEKDIVIESKWILNPSKVEMINTCNGHNIPSKGFTFSSERQRFENATRVMKELVAHCVIQMVK